MTKYLSTFHYHPEYSFNKQISFDQLSLSLCSLQMVVNALQGKFPKADNIHAKSTRVCVAFLCPCVCVCVCVMYVLGLGHVAGENEVQWVPLLPSGWDRWEWPATWQRLLEEREWGGAGPSGPKTESTRATSGTYIHEGDSSTWRSYICHC